jgi:DNA-binding NarL/FixJ family response regulator
MNIFILEDNLLMKERITQQTKLAYPNSTITSAELYSEAQKIIANGYKNFNLALLDINLPDGNGLELIRVIKEKNTNVQIIVITTDDDLNRKMQAFMLGADGFITKDIDDELLIKTLKNLAKGIPAVTDRVVRALIRLAQNGMNVKSPELIKDLSKTQKEVLFYVANGYTAIQIAKIRGVEPGTISDHRSEIYRKLKINSIAQATQIAMLSGLLDK